MAPKTPPEPAEAAPQKPRRKRRALRVAAWILGVPVTLAGLGVGYLHTGSGKAKVRHAIEERLNERVNGSVAIGDVDYALFGDVKVADVHVKDGAGVEAASLVSAVVTPSWSDLLRGRIVLEQVTVSGVRVHIVKDSDGGSNLDRLIKPRPEDPNKKPFDKAIAVKALSIGDVGVDILQPDGTKLTLADLAIEGNLRVLPSEKDVEVELGKIALAIAVDKGQDDLKLGITGLETGVTVNLVGGKGKATLHPLKGHVSVTPPRKEERGFDLALDKFSVDLGDDGVGFSLEKLLTDAVALGSVELKGHVAGNKLDGKQDADVLGLKVSGARVNELLGREVLACDIDVETHIHGPADRIEVTSKITTGGAAATLEGAVGVADPACPTYDVALSVSDVDTQKLLPRSLGVDSIGVDKLELTVKGKGRNPADAGGVAKIKLTGVKAQGVQLDGVDFEGELDKGVLKVRSVDAKALGQHVTASGEVELANKRVDLTVGLEGDVGELLGKLKEAGFPVKANLPRGAVRLSPGDLKIQAKGMLGGELDVTATAKRIGVLGGTVGVNARASVVRHDPPLEDGKKLTVTAMDADVHMGGIKLSSILALRGRKIDAMDGALSGDVHVEGTPEKPKAKLSLGLTTTRADGGKGMRLAVTGTVNPSAADLRASLTPSDAQGDKASEIFNLRAKLPLALSGPKKGLDPNRPLDIHAELAKTKLAALWELVPKTQALSNIQTLPEGDAALTLDVNGTATNPEGKLHATVTAAAIPGMTQKVEINGTLQPAKEKQGRLALETTVDAWYDDTKPKLAHVAADVDLPKMGQSAAMDPSYHVRADVGPLDLRVPTATLKKIGMVEDVVDGIVFLSADVHGNKQDLTGQVMASAEGIRPNKTAPINVNLSAALGDFATDVQLKASLGSSGSDGRALRPGPDVRVPNPMDILPGGELAYLHGKVGLAGKNLFEALKDKDRFDPWLALALVIPKRPLASLAPLSHNPPKMLNAPGEIAGSIAVAGTAKEPLAKGLIALAGVKRMDGEQGGVGLAIDAGKDKISALLGVGLPQPERAPLQVTFNVPRDAVNRLLGSSASGGGAAPVLPVQAQFRAKAVDLRALVPASVMPKPQVGVKGTLDWNMDIKASLSKTAKGLEIADGGVDGALDIADATVSLPGTKRVYHDVALHVQGDEKGLHINSLRAKESDMEQKNRSLAVKGDIVLDKLKPANMALSVVADKWLIFGPRALGFIDAPRATLSIDAQAKVDVSQPVKKASLDVKKLELISPERFERAHQPEDVQAGDVVFLGESDVPLGKLPVPASVAEKAQPKKVEVETEASKDSGYDIDVQLAGAHILRAPMDIFPEGHVHLKLGPNGGEFKGQITASRGSVALGGQTHPLVKGSLTFDEKNPKGYIDVYFERPLRPASLRNISEASAGKAVKIHMFGPLTDYKTVLSGAGNPGHLWDLLSINNVGRERRVTEPDLPGSVGVDFPQQDNLLVLSFLSVNLPHLLFLDRFSIWADPYDDPRAYGKLTHLEAERFVAGDSVRLRAGARPPTAGQSGAELEVDYMFVNLPRMLFGVGLTGGTRGGGGPDVVWEWSSKD